MSFFVSKVAASNHARGTAHAEASAEASLARRRRIEIQKIKNKKNKERRGEKKNVELPQHLVLQPGTTVTKSCRQLDRQANVAGD